MPDDPRDSDDPGWAAPHLPPRDPTTDAPAPGAPAAPPAASPAAAPPPPPPPSAAWAQPVPAGAAGAPTGATRRRRPWLVVLISVLAVILVSVVIGTVFFVQHTLPPFNAANDFVNDLADGEFERRRGPAVRRRPEQQRRARSRS